MTGRKMPGGTGGRVAPVRGSSMSELTRPPSPLAYAAPAANVAQPWWLRSAWRAAVGLGLYPLALLACLYATWAAARLALGHWPRASLDDPKDVGGLTPAFYLATGLLMIAMLPALGATFMAVVAAAVSEVARRPRSWRRVAWAVAVPAAGWAAGVWLLRLDPAGVLYWFMD